MVFGILILFNTSCENENCLTCEESPILDYQEFFVEENSPNGWIIDTVKVSNYENTITPKFEIIGGDPENVFSVDSANGVISVADSSGLDYESITFYDLAVKVTIDQEKRLSSSNTIKINVIDIQPTQEGLVAFYPFEGNAIDIVGENIGIEQNVEYLSSNYTLSDQVIAFNGIDSYVDLRNDFDFETTTISLWFNALKINELVGIIYTSDNAELEYGLSLITVRKDNDTNHLYFNVSGQIMTVEIEENIWYNATIIRDNKQYQYYLNGVLVSSGEFIEYYNSGNGNTTAVIGCLRTLDRRFYNGLVDNLRLYNRALSGSEINTLVHEY